MTAIWNKLHLVETMPGLGYRTNVPRIRQVRIHFGKRGYVARYTIRESDGALVILRLWHGREARK
jgi:toxin ParE1/3/4